MAYITLPMHGCVTCLAGSCAIPQVSYWKQVTLSNPRSTQQGALQRASALGLQPWCGMEGVESERRDDKSVNSYREGQMKRSQPVES